MQQNNDEWPKGIFWEKGLNILQNMQYRVNLEGQLKRDRHQITKHTEFLQPEKTGTKQINVW